jgi:peroxiredoxin (alkyl hydroperoxide reductase subunit C)
MTVRIGLPAPDVVGEAYIRGQAQPRRVSPTAYRGRWLVLFFYPRDFSRVCPTELQAFARLHREFAAAGAVVVGVSTDSYEAHKAWLESDPRLSDVTYPLVADSTHEMSEAYGVLLPDGSALRGTFVVDPGGIVRGIALNDPAVGRNVAETLRLVRALRTGQPCPEGWAPGQATLGERESADGEPVNRPDTAPAPLPGRQPGVPGR